MTSEYKGITNDQAAFAALGVFDGVHTGHRAVIEKVKEEAAEKIKESAEKMKETTIKVKEDATEKIKDGATRVKETTVKVKEGTIQKFKKK